MRRLAVPTDFSERSLSRNLIKVINTCAVPLVRYSGPFQLKQMDQRTRKFMTMHKALHPTDDFDRLYVSRKEGGRGLASNEDSVDPSIQRLYTKRLYTTTIYKITKEDPLQPPETKLRTR